MNGFCSTTEQPEGRNNLVQLPRSLFGSQRVLIANSSKLQLSLQLVGWGLLIGFGTDLVSVLAVIDIIANTANMPFPKFQVFLQSIFKCLKIHFLPLKSWAAIRLLVTDAR
ncbi:uncharacterized protein LOC143453283 [Clavelina lepadiformis]|uniref:uncharacterized protein LOC143453283 n=1 Tax=Clavelina lepadiformis TaxID=159417 RepID=UPI004042019C